MLDVSASPTRPIVIHADRMLTPDGLVAASLRVEGGRIVEIGAPPAGDALRLDARGLLVAPALVDVHGDAFERQMAPRPGVHFPLDVAALDTDRQLAANGIATAYHALTLSWEPGLRSVAQGEAFLDALEALGPRLAVEHRLQLRWETFAEEALPFVARALAGPLTPSLAFNDHTSMTMRPAGVAVQDRAPDCDPDRPTADPFDPAIAPRIEGPAKRAGLTPDGYRAMLAAVWERRGGVGDVCARLAREAAEAGAPMLSHDDNSPAIRAHYRGLGARIAEFPMNLETAQAARAAGDFIVFGSPNVVRGGSHLGGSPGAADMVEAGLCDILASDYFYPAMLNAAARLARDRRADLARAWDLVSGGPARASGLTDRGALAVGMRADIVLVDWPERGAPSVKATLSGGRVAHLSGMALS
jgi:alpha-D-ribose 1-methylphosphonate 5-triphosphate diphosphatase